MGDTRCVYYSKGVGRERGIERDRERGEERNRERERGRETERERGAGVDARRRDWRDDDNHGHCEHMWEMKAVRRCRTNMRGERTRFALRFAWAIAAALLCLPLRQTSMVHFSFRTLCERAWGDGVGGWVGGDGRAGGWPTIELAISWLC